MTGYTHRMPGICAASGASGTTEEADAWHEARAARERADRLEREIEAFRWRRSEAERAAASGAARVAELERRLLQLLDEYQAAGAEAKAGGE